MKETTKLHLKKLLINIAPALFVCMMILIGNTQSAHATDYPIDINTFKCSEFSDFVKSHYDTDRDGILSQAEADSVTQIVFDTWFNSYDIPTLNGIEVFRNLELLNAEKIGLQHLDVSKNKALKTLYVSWNGLTELDLSKNTELESVECAGNDIPDLVLPKGANLSSLDCFGVGIKSIDLTGCSELTTLDCGGNDLTKLDLSGNPKLTKLQCISTKLAALDLSHNPKLRYLVCSSNSFKELDLSKNPDLLYAYQYGWKNDFSYEGVEATEYGCMYGDTDYYIAVPPTTKIKTGGVYSGKDGTLIETSAGNYKVLSTKSKTVAYVGAPNKKTVTIPATFKVNGKPFKVTEVWYVRGSNIRTVTIGKNVKLIKADAFNASKATKVIIKTKLLKKSKIKNCFKNSKIKTVQVKVGSKKQNKTYIKKYKKYFTKANAGRKVVVK